MMRQTYRRWIGFGFSCALLAYAATGTAVSHQRKSIAKAPKVVTYEKDIQPLVTKYCAPCHGGQNPRAGLSLTKYKNKQSIIDAQEIWDKVAQNVASGHMPPAAFSQPTKAEREKLLGWIQSTLTGDCNLQDPGRVTMRRLNRFEYNNTVRDLIGVDLKLSDDFPSDDVGYGFDNIGDVLSISPLLMEKYLQAAEKAAVRAITLPSPVPIRYGSGVIKALAAADNGPTGEWVISSRGGVYVEHVFPANAAYTLRFQGAGQQAGPDPVRMEVKVDDKVLQTFDVPQRQSNPKEFEVTADVPAGKHRVSVEFINDFYQPAQKAEAGKKAVPARDRNAIVYWMEVVHPKLSYTDLPAEHRRIIFEQPTPQNEKVLAKKIVSRFAAKAYRRPATPTEIDRLTQIVGLVRKDGQPFERAIQVAVQAVLSSPNFLFRVETEGKGEKVGNYELASRLSYFVWSSMPDDELMKVAATGEIQKPAVIDAQVRRMLKSSKASALGASFGAQWLNLRKLPLAQPDPKQYPDFNENLREAMMTETEMFFDGIVREDRSVVDFLDARYTYANEALARHYGIPNVTGDKFRRVSLEGTPRSGVFTQGSILTLTSNPTRTSPVKRGKWVLDQILNTPPPPPPPGVGDLKDNGPLVGTLRQRMEQHRKDPSCASCHQRMDPIGFSMENFDATGKWREKDGDALVDASGVLPDGTKFAGPVQLRKILLARKPMFVRALSEKMLTFALGRGVEAYDKCAVDDIAKIVTKKGYRFSSLVSAVAQSDPFRKKRVVKGVGK